MSDPPKRLYYRLSTLLLLVTVIAAVFGAARVGYNRGFATGEADRKRSHVVTRLYEVQDLVVHPRDRVLLAEFLLENVAPGSWADSGGPGTVNWFEGPPLTLVISQTGGAHEQIEAYFEQFRENQRSGSVVPFAPMGFPRVGL